MSEQIIKTNADALRELTRSMFKAGLWSGRLDQRWPAFEGALCGFDPEKVAVLDPQQLLLVPALTRNRAKFRAVVQNARTLMRLSEIYGSFSAIIDALALEPYARRMKYMRSTFSQVGPVTASYFLTAVGLGELTEDEREDV